MPLVSSLKHKTFVYDNWNHNQIHMHRYHQRFKLFAFFKTSLYPPHPLPLFVFLFSE